MQGTECRDEAEERGTARLWRNLSAMSKSLNLRLIDSFKTETQYGLIGIHRENSSSNGFE